MDRSDIPEAFLDSMRYKLEKNKHKGHWNNMNIDTHLELLKKELDELDEAIFIAKKNLTTANITNVKNECADVANFCMFLHDIFNNLME